MNPIITQILLFGGFIFFMYFMLIKPNKKRQQEIEQMRNTVKVGDEIITIGGIKGRVYSVVDKDVTIETSEDGNKILFDKSAIYSIIAKNESNSEEMAEEDSYEEEMDEEISE